ncbi:MAG: hypothetical protein JW709_14055 [Sedimentisphaerales bacterium]|nr:hypothetical protein [Sedimentisphaerales bacterium]
MKQPPDIQKLEAMLRSGKLAAHGFMGNDPRSLNEIIDADAAVLANLGVTALELARRMQNLTDLARPYLGNFVTAGSLEVAVVDYPGKLVCPWPHSGPIAKRITTIRHLPTGRSLRWSDLNIHLIEEHGFFEGKGSPFRLEPAELVEMLA